MISKFLRFLVRKPGKTLVILDDFFPNLLTGFRIAEYNAYLVAFPHLRILSSYPHFESAYRDYASLYPGGSRRVLPLTPEQLDDCGLVYMNFLNNAFAYLPLLEQRQIPFIMTLYPGGGFGLHDEESDRKLDRIMQSPLLKHVIFSQKVTGEYLQQKYPDHGPRTMIFGGVANPLYFADSNTARAYFQAGKDSLDICFVAEKYMAHAANKGYPEFIETARKILAERPSLQVKFHVVGGCTPDDWNIAGIEQHLHFYGRFNTHDLKAFFSHMDMIVSPNKPFALHRGNFDGFPTGCCVEASLCGVCIVATDPLNLNPSYSDGNDILLVSNEPETIKNRILAMLDGKRLVSTAQAGQQLTQRLYSPKAQLSSRIAILRRQAKACGVTL